MYRIIIILICITGCSTLPADEGTDYVIDDELVRYVQEFQELAELPFIRSSVQFADVDQEDAPDGSTFIGMCYYALMRVEINRVTWPELPPWRRRLLVWHELAHCELREIDHRDEILESGCPASIMNSKLMSDYTCWRTGKEYYIQELLDHREDNNYAD